MPGKALSKTRRQRLESSVHNRLLKAATDQYMAQANLPPEERKGARAICSEITQKHHEKTGVWIRLCHSTVIRHAAGGQSQRECNKKKRKLLPPENQRLVMLVKEMGDREFPLSYDHIEECANEILVARLGDGAKAVGRNWAERWAEQNSDELEAYWGVSLKSKCGQAVNPTTDWLWWKMYQETVAKYDIQPENIWCIDKMGFQTGLGGRVCVMGSKGKHGQHVQRAGTQETITALMVVSAVGATAPPLVIFKGKAFLASWKQNNPLNAA